MNTIHYKISLYSWWHTGSGLAVAAGNDMTVIKDPEGFPFIPGKTMKGLFREASEILAELMGKSAPADFIPIVYGTRKDHKNEDEVNWQAETFFSNAVLPANLRKVISEDPQYNIEDLYDEFNSTAVDENGLALASTLRQMEVTMPLELYGTIEFFPEKKEYVLFMEKSFHWIKRLGLNRNRGFGRCRITKVDN